MLIDGGKPMRRNKWKSRSDRALSRFMGSLSLAAAGTGIPALAATKDVAVTEYDESALVKFKDNTLEYWEIPDSSSGIIPIIRTNCKASTIIRADPRVLRRIRCQRWRRICARRRMKWNGMRMMFSMTRQYPATYKGYKANMHALRAYAQQLEDAAKGKGSRWFLCTPRTPHHEK